MHSGWLFGGGSPLSSRLCDATAIGFAVWTVCCHAVVLVGGSLYHLVGVFAVALLAVAWRLRRPPVAEPTTADEARSDHDSPAVLALRIAGLAIGAGIALAISSEEHPIVIWWVGVAILVAAALALMLPETPRISKPVSGRRWEIALWSIAIACAGVALVAHRPDLDDSFYINAAVAAADAPGRPLLSGDTLLGVAGLPLHMPAHRLHSYELWNGAVSAVSGIPALYVFHWLAAAVVALLIPLCHARLFRILTPAHWVWSVAAFTLVLLASGETHRSYGNFSFVRSWQGKAVFLFVFMPLVYSYAIRFALRPTRRGWLLLAAAQVGALGCSSTAIWAAPAGALTALCCGLTPTRRGLRVFALGALASAYVLLAGIALRSELAPMLAPEILEYAAGAQFDSALSHVFGTSRLLQFGVATVLVAWACCSRGLARRFSIGFPLAVLLVLLNPYWDRFVAGNISGPSFWRTMWALPAPVLMTLVLTAPLQFDRGWTPRWVSRLACLILLAAFAIGVPKYSTLSPRNGAAGGLGIWFSMPGPKIPQAAFAWSQLLHDAVPAGSVVVAPPNISVWNPTFHDRTHPLQARRIYLQRNATVLGTDNANERILMTRFVGGQNGWSDPATSFRRGLDDFEVDAVCLRESEFAEMSRSALQDAGFVRTVDGPKHEIWVRGKSGRD